MDERNNVALASPHRAAAIERVPENLVRELIKANAIRWIPRGNRKYVVLKSLHTYLYGTEEE